MADAFGTTTADILGAGVSELVDNWKDVSGPMTFLFLAFGGYAAFQAARKAGA